MEKKGNEEESLGAGGFKVKIVSRREAGEREGVPTGRGKRW